MKTRITELAQAYQDLIGPYHHKDRDCHWEITETWKYGQYAGYVLTHNGYVYEDVCETYATYDDALSGLKHHLTQALRSELSWAIDVQLRPALHGEESVEASKHVLLICEKVGVTLENYCEG